MKPRAFNNISINYNDNLLIKSSSNTKKLRDEINYYLNLPSKIIKFFPRLIKYKKDFTSYTLEYIPYPTVADLIINNKITIQEADKLLKNILIALDNIHNSQPVIKKNNLNINKFYVQKTIDRICMLESNEFLNELVQMPYVTINKKIYYGFNFFKSKFTEAFAKLSSFQQDATVIHGDFCFSNILYSPTLEDIKLIDPRGSFGKPGIYGHHYYDYAKLLHCLNGRYDQIVDNRYKLLEIKKNEFKFKVSSNSLIKYIYNQFKILLHKRGIDTNLLHLVEASLFLSMAALHYEDIQRQKALFLNGLIILNQFFEGKYENLY